MHTKWDMGMTNENTQQHEASHGLSAIAELLVFQAAKPIEKRREKTYKNTAVTRYIHIAEILGSQISIYDVVSMQAILTQASRHCVGGGGLGEAPDKWTEAVSLSPAKSVLYTRHRVKQLFFLIHLSAHLCHHHHSHHPSLHHSFTPVQAQNLSF